MKNKCGCFGVFPIREKKDIILYENYYYWRRRGGTFRGYLCPKGGI
jgi:hypothetical protein